MNQLVEALKERQGHRTIAAYADDLDMRKSVLWRILNGQRGIGADNLLKIFRAYPDLIGLWLFPDEKGSAETTTSSAAKVA